MARYQGSSLTSLTSPLCSQSDAPPAHPQLLLQLCHLLPDGEQVQICPDWEDQKVTFVYIIAASVLSSFCTELSVKFNNKNPSVTEIKDKIKDIEVRKENFPDFNDKILYSSLQTKCNKFSRQQDTEEIELVSKVMMAIERMVSAATLMARMFQRADGGPVRVELTGRDEPGKN